MTNGFWKGVGRRGSNDEIKDKGRTKVDHKNYTLLLQLSIISGGELYDRGEGRETVKEPK